MKTLRLSEVHAPGFYWLRVRAGGYPKPGSGPWEMCEFTQPHAGWKVDIIAREWAYEFHVPPVSRSELDDWEYLDKHEFIGPLPEPGTEENT